MSEQIQQILLFTALPVFLMLTLERLTLFYLAKTPERKEWVRARSGFTQTLSAGVGIRQV